MEKFTFYNTKSKKKAKSYYNSLLLLTLFLIGQVSFAQPGNTCEDPIVVNSLPYSTNDNTANYGNAYDNSDAPSLVGAQYTNGTGSSYYLSDNDAVYSFTPTEDSSFNFNASFPTSNWHALWLFEGCSPFTSTIAYHTSTSGNTRSLPEINLTGGVTYYVIISSWSGSSTAYTLNITENTCTNHQATFTAIGDCDNNQFSVDVNITNMGSATNLIITDNQGSPSESATATGIITMGPYPEGTPVVMTIANTDDPNCTTTSSNIVFNCPTANDDCEDAVALTVGTYFVNSNIPASNVGATINTNDPTPTCDSFGFITNGKDAWFTVIVPASGNVTLETRGDGSSTITDTGLAAYSGTCGSITALGCNADDGEGNFSLLSLTELTPGDTILVRVWGYDGASGTFLIAAYEEPCIEPTGTVEVISHCETAEEFSIEFDIADLGSATTLDISDNQGNTQSLTAAGIVTFGPYDNGTVLTFEIIDADDENCFITLSEIGQMICPPSNDNCSNPQALSVGADFNSSNIPTTNVGATRSTNDPIPTCDELGFTTNGKDVWFTVVVPASGNVTLETRGSGSTTITDTGLAAYSGTCGSITALGCNADGGEGNFSLLQLTNLTPGDTILVRVWGYNGTSGDFLVAAYDSTMSTEQFENTTLKSYPNPVKDFFNVSYNKNISNISVINMLGQTVISKTVNSTDTQIDMTSLPTGNYFVKVNVDGAIQTVKVVKQ